MRKSRKNRSAGKPAQAGEGHNREILGVIVTGLGVWAAFALAGSGGGLVGEAMARGLRSLFGTPGCWAVPPVAVAGGVMILLKRSPRFDARAAGAALVYLALLGSAHLWHHPGGADVPMADVLGGRGGGLIGWGLLHLVQQFMGSAARYLFVLVLLWVGATLLSQVSLGDQLLWAGRCLQPLWSIVQARGREIAAALLRRLAERRDTSRTADAVQAEPVVPAAQGACAPSSGPSAPSTRAEPLRLAVADVAAPPEVVTAVPVAEAVAAPAVRPLDTPMQEPQRTTAAPAGAARPYQPAPLSLLPLSPAMADDTAERVSRQTTRLVEALASFGVKGAEVTGVTVGPAITRYEVRPAAGTSVKKFNNLADDLQLALAAEEVRIQAPIPGKDVVGIEVPNQQRTMVLLRDVLESEEFLASPSPLTVGLGKDVAGRVVVGNLGRMPHVLIAGSTGAGKSVCMNTLLCSILCKATPEEVKVLLIDPKRVELAVYEGIPHLAAPVVTDPRKAAGFLKWAVHEMETRYDLFVTAGVRSIEGYNELVKTRAAADPAEPSKPLPYIAIFIDELADLMMVAPADVEESICRLAQMARACGIHLVIATQRPSVDVITGLIKANIPSRIAFAVSSGIDSRTILDATGAEKLLGRGDMLYHGAGTAAALRAQGAFITESEVEVIVAHCTQQGRRPAYQAEAMAVSEGQERPEPTGEVDAVFAEAVKVVIEHGAASVSILQRRLRVNYTKAARLIDDMEQKGFIGPHQGSKPREVLIGMPQWEQRFGSHGVGAPA